MNANVPQPQISPERFTWDKFCSKMGYSQADIFNTTTMKIRADVEVIGYCPGNRLVVRPRTEGYAVMVWIPETDEEVWLHCLENNL